MAFANTAGGALIIGRDDDGRLRGVASIQDEEERLANAISDSIQPVLMPDIEVIVIEGKDLLVVRVARWPGPFYVKALGPEEGVYVRLGSTNRKAGEEQLAELRRTARHLVFDQLPCVGAELEDLDIQGARKAFSDRPVEDASLDVKRHPTSHRLPIAISICISVWCCLSTTRSSRRIGPAQRQ